MSFYREQADDEHVRQLVDATASWVGLPSEWPWSDNNWTVGRPPAGAGVVARKLLGKHRPKRFALSRTEAARIAREAGAEAVAKAEAAIRVKPSEAPLFAAAE